MRFLDIIYPVEDTVRLAADIARGPSHPTDATGINPVWTILTVLVALSLCISLILIYRRHQQIR